MLSTLYGMHVVVVSGNLSLLLSIVVAGKYVNLQTFR